MMTLSGFMIYLKALFIVLFCNWLWVAVCVLCAVAFFVCKGIYGNRQVVEGEALKHTGIRWIKVGIVLMVVAGLSSLGYALLQFRLLTDPVPEADQDKLRVMRAAEIISSSKNNKEDKKQYVILEDRTDKWTVAVYNDLYRMKLKQRFDALVSGLKLKEVRYPDFSGRKDNKRLAEITGCSSDVFVVSKSTLPELAKLPSDQKAINRSLCNLINRAVSVCCWVWFGLVVLFAGLFFVLPGIKVCKRSKTDAVAQKLFDGKTTLVTK